MACVRSSAGPSSLSRGWFQQTVAEFAMPPRPSETATRRRRACRGTPPFQRAISERDGQTKIREGENVVFPSKIPAIPKWLSVLSAGYR